MKKTFKESDIMIAFAQYHVARSIQILRKMIDNWYGMDFWMKAPDNMLDYLDTVRLNGIQAREVLEKAGFKFKKGTETAL